METIYMALPARNEIDKKYTWDAESVYADVATWEADTEELLKQIEAIGAFKGRLAESATVLADFMDAADSLTRLIAKVYFYAGMSAAVEMDNTQATSMTDQAAGLYGKTMAAVSFLNPELLAIGKDTLKLWMNDEARLATIGHYVDDLFRKQAHVRSAEVEEVLGLAQDPFGSIETSYEMLTTLDLPFPPAVDSDGNEHAVAQSTIDGFKTSSDRELRRSAYESYTGQYLQFKNAITGTYLTAVKRDVFNMRVRGYDSSLEASLFEDNIPTAVFENLIETFKKNLPTWHKYWDVRRKILGLDKLHPYDIWAPLTDKAPNNDYDQAVKWVLEGMEPMGEDYLEALRKGCLEQRWVDVYPNQGKRQGAFSWGTYDTHPFLMVSYDGSMSAVSTLAHELGHSMHSYSANKMQPSLYANYSMFVAEVASNFQQAMVRAHLQTVNDDVNFQIAIIEEAMDNFHRYFFIMPTLARFEYEIHTRAEKGMGMTADDLNTLCADLFAEGYGDTMTYDRARESVTWATFGHLYLNFYVFQYATGISAANFLCQEVMNGKEGAVQRYLDFVGAGGSMYPLDALKQAGVDMTQPDAVEAAFKVLADMVDRLEELTGV
jgi:oligoendopeptidase F